MTDRWMREGTVDSGDDSGDPSVERDGVATTEAYEQGGVVVLYDAENPLAWIETDDPVQVEQMV